MCGIAAVFHYRSGQRVDAAELDRMRDRMRPRGPDGSGSWVSDDGRTGLAHRRLAVVDLSEAGAQPMHDGELAIVFNGQIYNYRELRERLERRGARFRSHSDTEVLLHLYRERGAEMVEDLRGMFAFALWDGAKGGMLLARDPLGIKPLYLSTRGGTLRAASQVKALLAGGGVDTSPDAAGHTGFFLWGHVPEPFTLYRGIRATPAGTTLWVDSQGPREPRAFATLGQILREAGPARVSPGERAERLREAVRGSVHAHLRADVPVGAFLSSGFDSTTVVALASEAEGSGLTAFTLAFNEYQGTGKDESPMAEALARHYGTRHHTHRVEGASFAAELPHLLDAMDQPTVDGVNTYFVARAAAETGLKVAVSGVGGDEFFGGYPSFEQVPRSARLIGRVPGARPFGRLLRAAACPVLKRLTSPKYAGLLEYGGSFPGAYLLRRGLFMPWELPGILGADVAREGLRELRTIEALDETVRGLASDRLRMTALEATWYMRNQLLRDADWAGMAHSLEIRVPLVDVELLRALAPLLAGPDPVGKRDLAGTPARAIPRFILERHKSGFNIPTRTWLQGARGGPPARGLRGWAGVVYAAAPHALPVHAQ
jgi:asparagine synthase (glutamine-hydrolysing)